MLHIIDKLPDELWLRILAFLTARSLCVIQQVCRYFRSLVVESAALLLVIELEKSGLRPLHRKGQSQSQLQILKSVRSSRKAWLDLDLSTRTMIKIPFTPGDLYELSGGYFFTSSGLSSGAVRPKSLAYIRLPHLGDPRREEFYDSEHWRHLKFEEEILDFAVDVEQDLLIFVEACPIQPPTQLTIGLQQRFHVHIRTLSQGIPHPAAKHAVLRYAMQTQHVASRITSVIQIVGTHIAILLSVQAQNRVDALVVWDWTTGQHKGSIDDPNEPQRNILSFVLLSERHVLLPHPHRRVLELWSFDHRNPVSGETPQVMRLEACFELPDYVFLHAIFRSEPGSSLEASPHTSHLKSFGVNPEQAIISFTIHAAHAGLDVWMAKTFISTRRHFLDILRTHDTTSVPLVVHWTQWCGGTRWNIPHFTFNWICHTFGQRFIMYNASHVHVLDFNPVLYEDLKTRDLTGNASITLGHPGTAMVPGGECGLACVEIAAAKSIEHSGIMMDEERIIGLNSDDSGNLVSLDVYLICET